jgi:hypothetical protein
MQFKNNLHDAENVKFLRRWKAFNREKIESMRNPDIVLVGPGADPQAIKWTDVISTIEVKWREHSNLLHKAIGQLGDVAALAFHHQPNRQWFPYPGLQEVTLCDGFFLPDWQAGRNQ